VQEFETGRHHPIPNPHPIQMSAIVDDWEIFHMDRSLNSPHKRPFIFHSVVLIIRFSSFLLDSSIVFMASTLSYSSLDDIQDAVSCLRVNFDTGNTSNNKLDALTSKEQYTHLVSLCHG
jgi:hypothetical protein